MNSFYHHVYLSPHFDDAALSCGGAIHRQGQAGEMVLVITICAAPPEANEPLSPFAEAMHQSWGSPGDVVATRQAEDQLAMVILGADYLRLRFTDGIYRGQARQQEWYYTSNQQLFGRVHSADRLLAGEIVEAVLEMVPAGPETTLYAPLAAGHHIDHQLASSAARQLQSHGYRLAFYEDYPYVDPVFADRYSYPLETALAAQPPPELQPHLQLLAVENLAAKIDAIRAYRSQIAMLFESEAEMAACVRNYARQVGQGQLAERIWR